MCNRYAIENPDNLALWSKEMLEWEFLELLANLNAAPTELLPVVHRQEDGKTVGRLLPWGLRFPGESRLYMNAKKERALSLWRDPVQNRRCAVLADGFFEWPPEPQPKLPWMFRRLGHRPFAFAGIFNHNGTDEPDTFAFLTTTANEMTAAIGHPRSPVLLDESTVLRWLAPGPISKDELEALTQPYPGAQMERYRVTKRMNTSRYKEADCVQPLTPEAIAAEAGQSRIVGAEKADGGQLNLFGI